MLSSDRAVTGRAGRSRAWAVWVLTGALLVSAAFAPPSAWEAYAENITGTTELAPGAPATLQFRTSMRNDRDVTWWEVQLSATEIHAAAGPDSRNGVTVTVIGWVDGSGSSTCSEHWGEPNTGTSRWDNDCEVRPECSGDAIPCETTVEFELVSISDEPVTVSWVVDAVGGGFADR